MTNIVEDCDIFDELLSSAKHIFYWPWTTKEANEYNLSNKWCYLGWLGLNNIWIIMDYWIWKVTFFSPIIWLQIFELDFEQDWKLFSLQAIAKDKVNPPKAPDFFT